MVQAQYERMIEEHGALLENLEASEAARADLEQSISTMKVQGARDKREHTWVAPSFARSTLCSCCFGHSCSVRLLCMLSSDPNQLRAMYFPSFQCCHQI